MTLHVLERAFQALLKVSCRRSVKFRCIRMNLPVGDWSFKFDKVGHIHSTADQLQNQ